MVKLNAPTEVVITVKPLVLAPPDEVYDRMSKIEWRMEVMMARSEVRSALARFYYGGQ